MTLQEARSAALLGITAPQPFNTATVGVDLPAERPETQACVAADKLMPRQPPGQGSR